MKKTKICLFCGKSFEGGPLALYCSTGHRVLGNRKKKDLPAPIWSGQTSPDVAKLKNEIKNLKRTQINQLAEIDNLKSIIKTLNEVIIGYEEKAGKTEIEPEREDLKPEPTNPEHVVETDLKIGTIRQFVSFQSSMPGEWLRGQGYDPAEFYEIIRTGGITGPVKAKYGNKTLRFKAVKEGKKWAVVSIPT